MAAAASKSHGPGPTDPGSPGLAPGLAPDPRPDPVDNPWVRGLPPLRAIGWAGLLLPVPANWALYEVQGNAEEGRVGLADDECPRLRLQWGAVTRRRFNADKFVRRRLNRASGKSKNSTDPRVVEHPVFAPLMTLADDKAGIDRAAGYCPASGRVVEVVYHRGSLREDRAWSTAILPGLRDQPRTGPARWSFFDVSFVAPAGFLYDKATLNLGDMRVDLRSGARPNAGPAMGVRHVYPAGLALARRPLEAWLLAWGEEFKQFYRPQRQSLVTRGTPTLAPIQTPLGQGLALDMLFRPVYRPFLWRAPAAMRAWLIHDARANRLVGVWATESADNAATGPLDGRLMKLVAQAHWAGLPGGA
ncbi:MAG: hypothetical protein NTW19_03190 [Planctomycetota bacterium]|nr:hypothetical protein [Planctomycetota bacterium]